MLERNLLKRDCLLLFAVVTVITCSAAAQEESRKTVVRVSLKAASVEILVDGHLAGSGCFVDPKGLVATAAHVVKDATKSVEILTSQGERLMATFVAVDLGHDLILLQTKLKSKRYPHLPIRDPRKPLPPGSEVYLFSNTVFRHFILQKGIVARDLTTFEFQGHFVEVIQVSAFVQIGSSGGPWVDDRGQIVGIQSGAVTSQNQFAGIANVAPATALSQLIATQKSVVTSSIGVFVDEVWILTGKQLQQYPAKTNGLVIQTLSKNSPAFKAGIRKGDLVVGFGDKSAQYRDDFVRYVRNKKPGQRIQLQWIRPNTNEIQTGSVVVGRLEHGWTERLR